MITQDTDPATIREAQQAERYAWAHIMFRYEWQKTRDPADAQKIAYWQQVRENHQHDTGWLVEPLEGEKVRYYYSDPATRDQGGHLITWPKETD